MTLILEAKFDEDGSFRGEYAKVGQSGVNQNANANGATHPAQQTMPMHEMSSPYNVGGQMYAPGQGQALAQPRVPQVYQAGQGRYPPAQAQAPTHSQYAPSQYAVQGAQGAQGAQQSYINPVGINDSVV